MDNPCEVEIKRLQMDMLRLYEKLRWEAHVAEIDRELAVANAYTQVADSLSRMIPVDMLKASRSPRGITQREHTPRPIPQKYNTLVEPANQRMLFVPR